MRNLLFIPLLLLLVSCSSAKPKPEAFSAADRAIDAAVRAGAEQNSPVELRFAREKLAEAHKGMDAKQYDKSFYLIEQSEINAELAIEKSQAAILRSKVTEAERRNAVLLEDIQNTYGEDFK